MHIDVITLFPELVATIQKHGVVGRALQGQAVSLGLVNPREYSDLTHNRVDDRPYGGGPGMVMQYTPLHAALEDIRSRSATKAAPSAKQSVKSHLWSPHLQEEGPFHAHPVQAQ